MASVKDLQKIVEGNRFARESYLKLHKWLEDRVKEIKDAPNRIKTSFYCEPCGKDFDADGFKEVRTPRDGEFFAFYRGFCPAGHRAIKRITDKLDDPYYFKSPFVRKMQALHAEDMLTPADPRFKHVYPQAWKEIEERGLRIAESLKVK